MNDHVYSDLLLKVEALQRELDETKKSQTALLKQKNDEINEYNLIFNAALKQSPAGIIIVDLPNLSVKHINAKALEILGIKGLSDAHTKFQDFFDPSWKIFHPDGTEWEFEQMPIIQTAKTAVSFQNAEMYFIDNENNAKWLLINSAPVYDTQKKHSGVIVVFQDITQYKIKESAILQSENKFKNVLENSPMGIHTYLLNRNDQLIFSGGNPTADKLLGINHEELIGKTIHEAFPALIDTEIPGIYSKIAKEGIPWSTENVYYNDGKVSGAFEVFAFQSSPGNVAVMFLEITNRKIAEQKLKENEELLKKQNEEYQALTEEYQAQNEELSESLIRQNELNKELQQEKKKAEESDKLKSAFLANMSHEIRTPMNAIIGFADLLNQPNLQPQKTEMYVQIINSNSHQLLTLINDIIDISKIEAGLINISKSVININSLIKELYTIHSVLANRKSIKIKYNCGLDDKNCVFELDDIRLKQVLNNLLSNAIKFTSIGSIEYGYTYNKGQLDFFVKDTGIGIPEEYHHQVFERFRQVENNNKRKYGGTGLGLSISKALVELMGGQIGLESQQGMGTTFKFTIPVKPEVISGATKISGSQNELVSWPNKTILIAEDEINNYQLLDELLSSAGAKTLYASNGLEAVDLFSSNKNIDLVILDIKMPEMDGFEALAHIKKINPKITVLAQTAFAMPEDKNIALAAGFDYYITKPVIKEKLYSIINGIFETM
jgi:PAS domain S-box-containing protein